MNHDISSVGYLDTFHRAKSIEKDIEKRLILIQLIEFFDKSADHK